MTHNASDETVAKVLRDYQNPVFRTAHIAKKYGISAATITTWVKRAGLQLRSRGRKMQEVPTDYQLTVIRYAKATSMPKAAEHFGLKKQQVFRWVHRWSKWTAEDKPPFARGDVVTRGGVTVTVLRAEVEHGTVQLPSRRIDRHWPWSLKGQMAKKTGVDARFA